MKLKKGDKVIVTVGKDRGKTGEIVRALPNLNKVVVDGINMVKRAYKPSQSSPKGGIREEPRPLDVSNVAILHPSDNKRGSRIGFEFDKSGQKARVYRQADSKEIKS